MKNQKGFVPVIIILIVLIGFVGVYFLGTLKNKTTNVNPTAIPESFLKESPAPATKPIETLTPNVNLEENLINFVTNKVFDYGKTHGITNKNQIIVKINKFANGYATGTTTITTGGGDVWYATEVSGSWVLVEQTQEPASCNLMRKYNFPKGIYGECIEK